METKAWYSNKLVIGLLILFLPPVGLYFVFKAGLGLGWKVVGGIMSLFFVGYFLSDGKKSVPTKVADEVVEQSVGFDTIKIRDNFLAFESSFLDLDSKSSKLMGEYDKFAKNFGRYSRVEQYQLAKAVADGYGNLWASAGDLQVPYMPTDELKELAESMKDNLKMSFFMKKNAMEKLTEMIDGGDAKPSDITAMQEDIKSSQEYVFKSAAAMVGIKSALNIK